MWKKILLPCLLAAFSLTISVAEAARIGGGRSFGMQRQISPMQRQATPPRAAPQQAIPGQAARSTNQAIPGQQQSGWRKWAGPLTALAAGVGLAAMLSHFGVSGDFAGILLAVLAVVVVFALLRRFMGSSSRSPQPAPAYAGSTPLFRESAPQATFDAASGAAPAESGSARYPAGFDVAAFERQAKLNFIRLQAANDAGNIADIRDFTSPEIFAEIKLSIDERGGKEQRTDIVVLNAEVLEVVEEAAQYIASVHYSGSLREEQDSAPQAFNEVWHLSKPVNGDRGWMLAGIQQLN